LGNKGMRKGNSIFLLITFGLIYLMFSCAPAPTKKEVAGIIEEAPAQIKSINVISGPNDKETAIEITSSRPVPYTAFKLVQPLRLIVDIDALQAKGLTEVPINAKIVENIRFESIKDRPTATRVIAALSQDAEYNVQKKDRKIRVLLLTKKSGEEGEKQVLATKEEEIAPEEPRLFFSPGKTKLNQILGIDFFMLPKDKSRVTVTTSKKAEYELTPKSALSLLLEIKEATIPPELSRYIDSSQFKGVVNRITPIVKVAERQVGLEIELREMVPYHLIQADKEIRLDFNKTTVKPPAKKITPGTLTKAPLKPEEVPPEVKPEITPVSRPISPPKPPVKRYKGVKITLDFANADIRNILKLIGEVSKLNIVWGPEVKGTVSMRLKDVPWDQALDIVLEANDLGMRREGNIIWVTTRAKIKELEKEEEEKRKAEQERIKAIKTAQEEAKALEPLITGYIPVDFADADADIRAHIENIKSERGSITVDKRTNTIILTDIASIIEKAKDIVKEFDTPVKQIMIEARIVDASTTLIRDLGIEWNPIEGQRRRNTGVIFGIPTDATGFSSGGDQLYGGSFSTNVPPGWSSNIGLTFGRLTSSGLGALTLTASLALAETEGNAKIISAPKVIASNGEQAVISRGDIIYKDIVTADTVEVRELPATLSLTVKPTVSFNNYVTMDIQVKDDKVFADLSGKTEKSIETKLMVMSGDTVVIGGIYKEDKVETETGIPWLKDIPIFGWFFKARSESVERSELLIFLTPNVLTHAYAAQK
jgi:type IV pilus assembly protein PilQ